MTEVGADDVVTLTRELLKLRDELDMRLRELGWVAGQQTDLIGDLTAKLDRVDERVHKIERRLF